MTRKSRPLSLFAAFRLWPLKGRGNKLPMATSGKMNVQSVPDIMAISNHSFIHNWPHLSYKMAAEKVLGQQKPKMRWLFELIGHKNFPMAKVEGQAIGLKKAKGVQACETRKPKQILARSVCPENGTHKCKNNICHKHTKFCLFCKLFI